MNRPLRRIRVGAIALVVIFIVAVAGYRLLDRQGERTLLDDIWLVVITISTVGYGEKSSLDPARQIWTMFVIVFGLTASGYTIGGLLQLMTAGEIQRALGVRRMIREIAKLRGHVIICGFGRVGKILAEQLTRQHQDLVIVEIDPARIAEAEGLGYLAITGNALEEPALQAVGIDCARVLVTALPSDADNVFVALTARNLNAEVTIIASSPLKNSPFQNILRPSVFPRRLRWRWVVDGGRSRRRGWPRATCRNRRDIYFTAS